MGIPIPVVEVSVLSPNGRFAEFHVTFYGIPISEFRHRQEPPPQVMETFRRRGLDVSSPLVVRERTFEPTSSNTFRREEPHDAFLFRGLNG